MIRSWVLTVSSAEKNQFFWRSFIASAIPRSFVFGNPNNTKERTMLKIAFRGAAGALILLILTAWLGLSSYAQTLWARGSKAVDNMVSVEFELERIGTLAAQVQPEIEKSITAVAEEDVAVRDIASGIQGIEKQQEQRKPALRALRDALKAGEPVSFGGRSWSRNEVEADLTQRLSVYNQAERELTIRRELLKARKGALAGAEQRLASARSRVQELELHRQQLRARLSMLEASNKANNLKIDDSALTRAEQALAAIDKRLSIAAARQQRETGPSSEGLIPVEPAAPQRDLDAEVSAALGE